MIRRNRGEIREATVIFCSNVLSSGLLRMLILWGAEGVLPQEHSAVGEFVRRYAHMCA